MKNIDKHKTPQEKMEAWEAWARSQDGCEKCNRSDYCDGHDRIICFNAWLHSTTEKVK